MGSRARARRASRSRRTSSHSGDRRQGVRRRGRGDGRRRGRRRGRAGHRRRRKGSRGRARSIPTSSTTRSTRRATTRFAAPDEWYGVATADDVDGRARPTSTSGATTSPSVPTDEKVRIALELERATAGRRPAHPQRRVGELRRLARRGRARELVRRRGVVAPHACARARRSPSPTRAPARRPATASRSAARSPTSTSTMPPRDAASTARAPSARRQAESRAAAGDARPARHAFGARCPVARVQRRVDAEGPLDVRRPRGRAGRGAARARCSTIRPTPGRSAPRRTTATASRPGATS